MPLKRFVQTHGVWALLLVVAFLGMVAVATATEGDSAGSNGPAALLAAAEAQGTVRVIVGLYLPFSPQGQRPDGEIPSPDAVTQQQAAVAQAQDDLLARLAPFRVADVQRLHNLPYLALEVDAAALAWLLAAPDVRSIEPDEPQPPALDDSVPLIGGGRAADMGYTGAGWRIAILDTGVDKTHPFLQGKVVEEACFSTTNGVAQSLCPDGAPEQVGPGAGVNCPPGVDGCAHGTHVAGIAAGRHPEGDDSPRGGVAPDARLIAVQVFSRFNDTHNCQNRPLPCALSYGSDQLRALDHIYTLATKFRQPIAAVNMSIGSGQYTAPCDAERPARAELVGLLRSVGIATIASSGNNGYTNAVGLPACLSLVVSVGASSKNDTIPSFSNSAPFLSLLAPGVNIRSSVPGGDYAAWQGTSMAAPHVAGAWALLKQKQPDATVSEILSILTQTGQLLLDGRNNVVKPRIQVDAALAALGATATPTPTPTVTLTPTLTPTPTPIAPQLPIEAAPVTLAPGHQVNPAAVFNPQRDEFLVIWADARGGGFWRIFGQRLSPQGALVGSNFLIAEAGTPLDREPPYPQVAWNDISGEYLVAWRSADVGGIVYGQRLSALGERVGNRLSLSPTDVDTAYIHQRLALAHNPHDNEYLLAWADERIGGGGRVMLQRLNPQGQPLGGLTPVCPVCAGISQRNPAAVYNPAMQEYFVVWQELVGASIDIVGQRVTRVATTLTAGIPIAAAPGTQNLPAVTWHPLTNQYMVVWRDARQDPASVARRSVWGRLVTAEGALPAEARALSSVFTDQRNPAVAWHGGDRDGYLVLWADARAYGGTDLADNTDLLARWLGPQGQPDSPFGHDVLVSRNHRANNPALAYAATWSRFLLVWQDNRYDAGTAAPLGFDILAAVYATGPIPTRTPTPTATTAPPPTATPTATPAPTDNGSGIVVLQQGLDGYAGARDTYLDRYSADEPLGQRLNLYFYINDGDGQARSILVDFALEHVQLPPASEVVAAYLSLYQHTFDGRGALAVRAFALNRAWDERQATWLRPLAGAFWQMPGADGVPGDRHEQGSEPVILNPQAGNGWKQWDVTDIVRDWLRHPAGHFGLKLLAAGDAQGETFAWFHAKENWQQPELRPRLEIHYAKANANVTPTPTPTPRAGNIIMRHVIAPMLVNGSLPPAHATPQP